MAAAFWISSSGIGGRVFEWVQSEQNPLIEPDTSEGFINHLDDSYRLLSPIRVKYERSGDGFLASFAEANIAVSGLTKQDACEALVMEILDAFDDWTADESALGPGPLEQLTVLKKYITKVAP